MSEIEELKAKHAAEIAEAERKEAVLAILPLKPKRIMFHSGRTHIYYEAESLADALATLINFEPVPFARVRGTFLHHDPISWIKPRDIETATSVTDGCWIKLDIDGGKGFGPNATFVQWVQLPGELAEVHVSLGVYPCGKGFPAGWRVTSEVSYNRRGDVIEAAHFPPAICGDLSLVTWSNSHARDSYHYSWVWMEVATFEREMARFAEPTASEAPRHEITA
jgi:hypothetical protein